MLTPQNRAKLRSIASTKKDLLYIGQNNITDNLIEQIRLNLYAHELIKIKVQKGADYTIEELGQDICKKANCELVAIIGNKIILYKYSDKPKIEHLL